MGDREPRSLAGKRALLALALACWMSCAGTARAFREGKKFAKVANVEVEVKVQDEAFKAMKALPSPQVEALVRVNAKGEVVSVKVETGDDRFYEGEKGKEWEWDEKEKKLKVTLVAKVFKRVVGHADPAAKKPPKLEALEFQDAEGGWHPVPKEAHRWEADEDKGRAVLAFIPAAFHGGKAFKKLRLVAEGCLPAPLSLDPKSPEGIALARLQVPDLPAFYARKYPGLQGVGRLVDAEEYVGMKLPIKGDHFYIAPGFVPFFARPDKGQVQLWYRFQDRWGQYHSAFKAFGKWPEPGEWPRLEAGELKVSPVMQAAPGFRRFRFELPEGEFRVVVFGDKVVGARPWTPGERAASVAFDLPEMYAKAVEAARARGLSALAGLEELESRAELRYAPKAGVAGLFSPDRGHRLEVPKPNFGLRLEVRYSETGATFARKSDHEVEAKFAPALASVELDAPDDVPFDADKLELSAWNPKRDKFEPLDSEAYLLKRAGKEAILMPALLVALELSPRVRAELPGGFAGEAELQPGKTPKIVLRQPGLTVRLPKGLKAKPVLRLAFPKKPARKFELDPAQPEQLLKREALGASPEGAHAELRVPGHKPVVVAKLSGTLFDASKLEPVGDSPFVAVVNDWVHIVSPNDEVRANIAAVQKEVCRALAEQATKAKGRLAGFALVDKSEAAWPAGSPEPAFLSTGAKPPLPKSARRDGAADGPWKELRVLLSHPDVAAQHESILLVVVAPWQRFAKIDAENPDRAWVLERIKECGLRVVTVVVGGPDARTADLEKAYLNPAFLKVGKEGVDFGTGKSESIDKLPGWLKEKAPLLAPKPKPKD
ncbi:MAG: hypothetical protein K2W96_05525 [Gemmataceae bacterium]|nr:hypothetical protein [Gemmataceae bacterium]